MAGSKARYWLPPVGFIFAALLLRQLLLTVAVNAAFPEASQPQAPRWWSLAARTSRPGGWIVPGSLEPIRHTHDFQTVAVPVSNSFELIFPQLGNGRIPSTGAGFRTMLTAANFSNQPAHCRLSFFGDDGLPLALPRNGASVSSLDFELATGQQWEFETSGEGEVVAGWALLESDQPVAGQAVFGLRDPAGALVTEVGVSPADRGSDLTVLGDSLGDSQTGIALANPGPDPLRVTADLLNAEGGMVASEEIEVDPHGHLAVFLNELFEGTEGIEEFLGSVRLRSPVDTPFAAVTLRSTGNLLTSLPTVTPPPPESQRTRLAFPHVADGVQDPLSITTALVLFNITDLPSSVTLDFFRSDSNPMTVEIDGVSASSFDFELQPRGVLKVETQGEGELRSGWARAAMDQPLSGSAIFRVFRSAAPTPRGMSSASGAVRALETEVGVMASPLYGEFRILADTRDGHNTGLAVANPDADDDDLPASLVLDLWSAGGALVKRTQIEVPPGGHRAVFVDELFPHIDLDDFTGFLSVLKTGGPKVVAVALRSAGAMLTSTPTLFHTNGFAPLIEIGPLQNLAGTRPGFAWLLHQSQDDLALRELTIDLPGTSLSDELDLDQGDEIGNGYFVGAVGSRISSLVVREAAPDRLVFDAVVPDPEGAVPGGQGEIRATADGIEIQWSLTEPEPFSRTLADIDHRFFLFPGVVAAPSVPGTVEVETELVSVSSSPYEELPAVRRIVQSFQLVEPAIGTAVLEAVSPVFVLPNEPVRLAGSNLGDSPTVTFPVQSGATTSVPAYRNGDGILEVQAPLGVAEGRIFVDNGNGAGNGYSIFTLFSPVVDFVWVPVEDPLPTGAEAAQEVVIMVHQPGRQLALSHFGSDLHRTELDFQELMAGQPIGTGSVREDPFTTIELAMEVGAVEEDRATIDVLQADSGNSKIAELILTRITDLEQPAVQLEYRPVTTSLDTVILGEFSPLELELRLVGAPLMHTTAGLVSARFRLFSAPTLAGLGESALQVTQFGPALTAEEAK